MENADRILSAFETACKLILIQKFKTMAASTVASVHCPSPTRLFANMGIDIMPPEAADGLLGSGDVLVPFGAPDSTYGHSGLQGGTVPFLEPIAKASFASYKGQ